MIIIMNNDMWNWKIMIIIMKINNDNNEMKIMW